MQKNTHPIIQDKPLKIAVFGHKHIDTRDGGIEVVVTELYGRIGKTEDVTIYDRWELDGKKIDHPKDAPYKVKKSPTLKNGKINAVAASFFSTLQCKFGRYDVIHTHAEGPCVFLPLIKNKRIVSTVHGLDWQRAKWGRFGSWYIKTGEKMMAKYADEIIVLSEDAQKYFKETYGRDTKLIKNGVSVVFDDNTNKIEKFGLQKGRYILYVGRMVPEKRLDLLINAYKLSGTKIPLVIGGALPEDKGTALKFAEKEPDIVFPGFVNGDLLNQLYTNAGLFVLPSDLEGMSISLLEAMAYGIPCLTSDIAENKKALSGFGHTFKAGDVEDLTRKLIELTERPTVVRDAPEMLFVHNNYNWDKVTKATLVVLRDVATREESKKK